VLEEGRDVKIHEARRQSLHLQCTGSDVGGPQRDQSGLGHIDAQPSASLGLIDDAEELGQAAASPSQCDCNVVGIGDEL
jgi:hypothetical protein